MSRPRNIAVVYGPGGLPGLEIHAGAQLALADAGIDPCWVGGTSAGAVAAATHATGMQADQFAELITGLRTRDVISRRRLWRIRTLFGLDHLATLEPIRAILEQHVADKRLHRHGRIAATEMQSPCTPHCSIGRGFSFGPSHQTHTTVAIEWVLASLAIPGIFPYVPIGESLYSDGGTTVPYPLPVNAHAHYDHVIVINPFRPEYYQGRDSSLISRLLWAVEQISRGRDRAKRKEITQRFGDRLLWIDVPIPRDVSMLEFSPKHDLITNGYHMVQRLLARIDERRDLEGMNHG